MTAKLVRWLISLAYDDEFLRRANDFTLAYAPMAYAQQRGLYQHFFFTKHSGDRQNAPDGINEVWFFYKPIPGSVSYLVTKVGSDLQSFLPEYGASARDEEISDNDAFGWNELTQLFEAVGNIPAQELPRLWQECEEASKAAYRILSTGSGAAPPAHFLEWAMHVFFNCLDLPDNCVPPDTSFCYRVEGQGKSLAPRLGTSEGCLEVILELS